MILPLASPTATPKREDGPESDGPELVDLHPAVADMERLVIEGLSRHPRQLPAWFLYDAEGSRLFERICEQPEYSLTRSETKLLQERAGEMAQALGQGIKKQPVLVEFGAGNLRKVGPLLETLQPAAYVALDISADHLAPACRALQSRHPDVPVLGICCDYAAIEHLPPHPLLEDRPRIGFYPGSSLGNFDPAQARLLLAHFAELLGPGSRLLIGIDQPREAARLEAAYDDAAGVSAAFAFNLLHRLNRELAGNFDPAAFRYEARWQPAASRIAMALVSLRNQKVDLAGRRWSFAAGEPLISEYSVKYTPEAFLALAAEAGWRPLGRWSDGGEELSLHLLVHTKLHELTQQCNHDHPTPQRSQP